MDNRLSQRVRVIFRSRVEEVEAESSIIPKCRYLDRCQISSDDVQYCIIIFSKTDGGTRRSGTFHGEMGLRRESQGRTTSCSSMPKRDGK